MASIPLPALGINPPQQQNPLGNLSQIMAIKSQMGQQQIQQGQIQEQQQALQMQAQKVKDQKTVTQLFIKNNGDLDQTIADAAKAGVTPETLQALQLHAIDVKGKTLDLVTKQGGIAKQQADLMQGAHATVAAAAEADRPKVYQQQLMGLQSAGVDVSKMPLQYPGDEMFKVLGATVQGYSSQIDQALKASEQAKNTAQAGEATAAAAQKNQEAQYYLNHGGAPGVPAEVQQQNAWLNRPENKGKDAADYKSWAAKQTPMGVVMGNQLAPGSPALDQAAEKYSSTGALPSGFARSPGTLTAIMNRAAELHPTANLAGNAAVYGANKKALGDLQSQFSKVDAFEGTALKNLDLYVQKVKAIPDLGVKFANAPLRSITGSMIGEQNYAAMEAARKTASAEVGKVLSSATGSGVLSDSQRKEAEDVLNGNLPLAATLRVVETLKQDLANRHQSYQQEIDHLHGMVGGTTQNQPSQTPPAGGDFFSNFGGKPR